MVYLRHILWWRLKSFLELKSFLWSVLEKRSWLKNVKFLWSFLRLKFVLCCQFQSYGSFLALENEPSKDCQIGGCFAIFFLNSKMNFSSKKIWAVGKIWAATKECVSVIFSVACKKYKRYFSSQNFTHIGKQAAEKSKGLFSAEDWQCGKCGNINWARDKWIISFTRI